MEIKKDTAKLENLLIEAIKQFKRENKYCEIRSLYAAEGSGTFQHYTDMTFCIKYVTIGADPEEAWQETYIRVYATSI